MVAYAFLAVCRLRNGLHRSFSTLVLCRNEIVRLLYALFRVCTVPSMLGWSVLGRVHQHGLSGSLLQTSSTGIMTKRKCNRSAWRFLIV